MVSLADCRPDIARVVAQTVGSLKLRRIQKVEIVDRYYLEVRAKTRRNKIRAVQHIQPERRDFGSQRSSLEAMMCWRIDVYPLEIVGGHKISSRGSSCSVENVVFILLIEQGEGFDQAACVFADPACSIAVESSVNANSHCASIATQSISAKGSINS